MTARAESLSEEVHRAGKMRSELAASREQATKHQRDLEDCQSLLESTVAQQRSRSEEEASLRCSTEEMRHAEDDSFFLPESPGAPELHVGSSIGSRAAGAPELHVG